MRTTYSVKLRGAESDEAHAAEIDVAEVTYRSLDRARRAAAKVCREYNLRGEIYDAQSSLVLRVTGDDWSAP